MLLGFGGAGNLACIVPLSQRPLPCARTPTSTHTTFFFASCHNAVFLPSIREKGKVLGNTIEDRTVEHFLRKLKYKHKFLDKQNAILTVGSQR